MFKQLHLFFNALVFFTRIPAPSWVDYNIEYQRRATCYGPLIGYIVGLVSVFTLIITSSLLPFSLALILSIVVTIIITGALHEDGFADVCDGFGASQESETILRIMKDPRIGCYGVLGVVLLLLLKYAALLEIAKQVPDTLWLLAVILIAGHSSSRLAAVSLMASLDYVRPLESSKSGTMVSRMSKPELSFAVITGLLPLLLFIGLGTTVLMLAVLPLLLVRYSLACWFQRRLGGYTGDCLGCVQQVSEVVFYLSVCILLIQGLA